MTNVLHVLLVLKLGASSRAFNGGRPFDTLKPEHYEHWKEVATPFDPRFRIHRH
jgi:hypothetical protein